MQDKPEQLAPICIILVYNIPLPFKRHLHKLPDVQVGRCVKLFQTCFNAVLFVQEVPVWAALRELTVRR